jgi:hypothetical protein
LIARGTRRRLAASQRSQQEAVSVKYLLSIAYLAVALLTGPQAVHAQTLPSAPPHITLPRPQLTLTHGPVCCLETRPGHFQTTINTLTVTNAGYGTARDVTLVVSHVTRDGENGPFNIPELIGVYKGAFVALELPQPPSIAPACIPNFVDGTWTRHRCTYHVDLQKGEQLQVRFRWGGCPRREPRHGYFMTTIQATTQGDSGRGLHTFSYNNDTRNC